MSCFYCLGKYVVTVNRHVPPVVNELLVSVYVVLWPVGAAVWNVIVKKIAVFSWNRMNGGGLEGTRMLIM